MKVEGSHELSVFSRYDEYVFRRHLTEKNIKGRKILFRF